MRAKYIFSCLQRNNKMMKALELSGPNNNKKSRKEKHQREKL
jgi:hypothetical protein